MNISLGTTGAKQWNTTSVVEWLESPDGEEWSKTNHDWIYLLVMIKDDDPHEWFFDFPAVLWRA